MAYKERYDSRTPPVSAHPLFPWIMALWFAALLGFGSLILSGSLVGQAFALVGIAPGPAIGAAAKIGVCVALALIGGLIGLRMARRIAAAHEEDHDPVGGSNTLARLRSSGLGSGGLGEREPSFLQDEPDIAALTTAEQIAQVLERPLRTMAEDDWPMPETAGPDAAPPLDLSPFEASEEQPPAPASIGEDLAALKNRQADTGDLDFIPEPAPEAWPGDTRDFVTEPSEPAWTEDQPPVFSAPSQTLTPAPASEPVSEPEQEADGLGMAALAERLAGSILQQRRSPPPLPAGLAEIFERLQAEYPLTPVPENPAASDYPDTAEHFVPPPPVVPESLRPIPSELEEFGEEEDENSFDFELNFPRAAEPTMVPPQHPIEMREDTFTSLLATRGAAQKSDSALHIDEQNTGDIPPARRGVNRDEAEHALRSALAELQRLSGAA